MKAATTSLLLALTLLIAAPLLMFLEIRLVGNEPIGQTLPLIGTAVILWLSGVAEAFVLQAIGREKVSLQLKALMLCKVLRFLLSALLLIAYAILATGDTRLFAVNLIVFYFVVTAVLTASHVSKRKKDTTASPETKN